MASFHLRSISLPSRSHPLTVSLEEQLHKLKTSESSSISHKLSGLKELYDCLDDFLQLPLTQQTLFHEKLNSAEEASNGSLELLDMCGATRDLFSQMREFVQGLELSLRRRRSGECVFNGVDTYIVSRKKLNKVVGKYLKSLKKQEKNCRTTTLANDSDSENIIVMLKGVKEISVAVFESILTFISLPKAKSKLSIVSKLMQSKHVSCEGEANEVEKIDSELLSLKSSKGINRMQNILKGLESLDLSLKESEEELECVYRRMVKTRVSLLNIVNH